jgi:hypothetical protein
LQPPFTRPQSHFCAFLQIYICIVCILHIDEGSVTCDFKVTIECTEVLGKILNYDFHIF